MTQLKNAVVLITGATGGFGQELTRQLLKAGSRLILSDLEADRLEQQVAVQQEISTGEVLACLAADLSTSEGCDLLYEKVQALSTSIDILINNAGIAVFVRLAFMCPTRFCRLFFSALRERSSTAMAVAFSTTTKAFITSVGDRHAAVLGL